MPAGAQDLHCNRAIKKQAKSEKKESKIQKKMFRDRPFKASRKLAKSEKKEQKVEDKEFVHSLNPGHDKARDNF